MNMSLIGPGRKVTGTAGKRCRAFTTILLLCTLVLGGGCTASFTYNHLDWLIPWWVDDYVDLTRDQRRELRIHLQPALTWHREVELGRYLALIDRIEADLEPGVGPEDVQSWFADFIDAAERVEASLLRVALDFGEGMTQEQVQEFMEAVWEQQSEYEAEYLGRSDAEYEEDNAEYLVEGFDRLMGRLSAAQEDRAQRLAEKRWPAELAKGGWEASRTHLCPTPPPWLKGSFWGSLEHRARPAAS